MQSASVVVGGEPSLSYHQFGFGASEATLLIFTPKIIPDQVLRPYQYNFNNKVISDVLETREQRMAMPGAVPATQDMRTAILPKSMGMLLDTQQFNSQYSFVLIIDTIASNRPGIAAIPGPNRRQIITGFFTAMEPPFTMGGFGMTPVYNMNAVMVFTHSTQMMMQDRITSYGGATKILSVNQDVDTIPQTLAQLTPEDPYILTPENLRDSMKFVSQSQTISTPGKSSIAAQGGRSAVVASTVKQPKYQLDDIVQTIDDSINLAAGEGVPRSAHGMCAMEDPGQNFLNAFDMNAASSYTMMPAMGLDTTCPMSLGELCQRYPNIKAVPYQIPATSQWEVRAQTMATRSTIMSSMIVASLNTICVQCNICDIVFRYNSWLGENQKGKWHVNTMHTVLPAEANNQAACLNAFRHMMETSLFPTLYALNGHFDMQVTFSLSGDNLVDFRYLDDIPETGYYETCNRLGGMISPIVGGLQDLQDNAVELNGLLNAVSMEAFGTSAVNTPTLDQPIYNTPF